MNLKESLEALKEAKKIANSDPFEAPKATRSGYQTLIAQMRAKLPELVNDYVKQLEKNIYKVYFTGDTPKNAEFVELLSKNAVVISTQDLYGEVAARVEPTLGKDGNFGSESWRRYIEVIGEYARKYGVVAKKLPVEPAGTGSKDLKELRLLIKKVTEEAFGWDLNKMYIYETVYKKASELNLTEGALIFVPIFVDDLNERDIINTQAYTHKPSYTVTFKEDEEPTVKLVQQFIKQVQKTSQNKE